MVSAKRHPSEESDQLRDLKLTCMDNLLATTEARLYFKDLESRFLLVSAGCDATVPSGHALAYQVLHDPVTGLVNRFALLDRLAQALTAMERLPGRVAVLFVDIDHFKEVNDSFGHDAGDQVLAEVGRRLSRFSRHSDTAARLGGDEFVVLCTLLSDDDDMTLIAGRIVEGVR